jgi:hypothetical protein
MCTIFRQDPVQANTRPLPDVCHPPFQPMRPYLPPELIETIIEQIEGEVRKTLAACSLVWVPITQSKYFKDLGFG